MVLYVVMAILWLSIVIDIYMLCKTSNKGRVFITEDNELFLHLDIPVEEVKKKKFLKLEIKNIKVNTINTKSHE